ncbi:MAG: hypothetical protein J7K78_02665 [Thaumarchaeota archaeon]|nr:hypothetical protein [Nitrososphaerota archaeon]
MRVKPILAWAIRIVGVYASFFQTFFIDLGGSLSRSDISTVRPARCRSRILRSIISWIRSGGRPVYAAGLP